MLYFKEPISQKSNYDNGRQWKKNDRETFWYRKNVWVIIFLAYRLSNGNDVK